MACLDKEQRDGGDFVTWAPTAEGQRPVGYDLKAGDGVLFYSEKTHNVSPVTKGVRHSLVIELWRGGENVHDRSR